MGGTVPRDAGQPVWGEDGPDAHPTGNPSGYRKRLLFPTLQRGRKDSLSPRLIEELHEPGGILG